MSRSKLKGVFFPSALYRCSQKIAFKKIFFRSSLIPLDLIGSHVLIYNGRVFRTIQLSELNVGHKFGEFALTRVIFVPKKKKQKNKTKKPKKK